MTKQTILDYMYEAIRLSRLGRYACSPNPAVGAVIVKRDKIIARGYTQAYGKDHAEVSALKNADTDVKNADMYVTLEPCSHFGKTPPCAKAIIEAGIKRVFIGMIDPNPLVFGKGIAMLEQAGIEVQCGIFDNVVRKDLEYYVHYMTKQRPFFIIKTALSLDGKYCAPDGSSQWITDPLARAHVHNLRSQHDAVLASILTVMHDDALLNVRLNKVIRQPLRIVLDAELQLPEQGRFAQSMHDYPALIICRPGLGSSPPADKLKSLGADIAEVPVTDDKFNLRKLTEFLYGRKMLSVMIESGSILAESFLKAELADKCYFFYGNKITGGTNSPYPTLGIDTMNNSIVLNELHTKRIGNSLVVSGYPAYK